VGGYLAIPEENALRNARDQFTHVSYELGKIRREGGEAVYLLGGSSARESIESVIPLEKKLGHRFVNLGYYKQSFGESIAIIDQLPEGGTLLIGVNVRRFIASLKDYVSQLDGRGLLVHSEALLEFIRSKQGVELSQYFILPGFVRYLRKYYRAHQESMLSGNIPWIRFQQHFYDNKDRLSSEGKQELFSKILQIYLPAYKENFALNMSALRSLINLGKERRLGLVFLELPLHPKMREIFGKTYPQYKKAIQSLSYEEKIPYWDLNPVADLLDEDFYDHTHLIRSGRLKFQNALAAKLHAHLHELRLAQAVMR